jgi:mannose-6-phosphate isomerase-like protein (cupin superfamily)
MNRRARHVKAPLVEEVREENNHLTLRKLVNTVDDGPDLSVTWVKIDGEHGALSTKASTRVYYILQGEFVFRIDDQEDLRATEGDAITICRECIYSFIGKGSYLVINGPGFQEGDDKYHVNVEDLSEG